MSDSEKKQEIRNRLAKITNEISEIHMLLDEIGVGEKFGKPFTEENWVPSYNSWDHSTC